MLFKNTASQKIRVYAFDSTTGLPKTGDAANISAYISKDFGAVTQLTDTSATEGDATNAKGYYLFDISQTETNADDILISAKSSTSNIVVVGAPARIATRPPNASALSIDSNGRVDIIKIAGTTQTGRDLGASVLLSPGTGAGQVNLSSGKVPATLAAADVSGNVAADLQTIKTQTVTCSGGVTIPAATLASTTNITAAAGCAVSSIGNNVITAASAAADFGAELQALITGGAYALSTDANGRIRVVDGTGAGEIDTTSGKVDVSDKTGFRLSATGVDDIWDEVQSGHTTAGTFGKYLDAAVSGVSTGGVSAADIATALWQDLTASSDFTTTGSIGKLLVDNINATISSRLASASYTAPLDAAGVRAAVGLASANLDTQLTAIDDYIDTEIATILSRIGVPVTSLAADLAALNDITASDVWAAGTRTLTAGTNIVLAKGTGVTGFNDLSAAAVNAEVVDALATDTYTEPAQGAPLATTSLAAKLGWLYASWRNKKDNDGTTTNLYGDDGSTILAKQGTSVSSGTVTKAEWITGA